MTTRPSASRVFLWSLLMVALAGAFGWLSAGKPTHEPVPEPIVCQPLPTDVEKIGPPLTARAGTAALDTYSPDFTLFRSDMRPGDTVHEFGSGVVGGHLVMRGPCYIGQAVAWIR
jgi:hypothetical protein